jgi:plasmid stabilization system protein ParE
MAYKLSIRREAEADIAEAYQYYEDCRPSLGSAFMICIDEAFSRIERNPRQYGVIGKDIRRALVKRFTYGVFYTLNKSEIIVLAVAHARRNPVHWQSRT